MEKVNMTDYHAEHLQTPEMNSRTELAAFFFLVLFVLLRFVALVYSSFLNSEDPERQGALPIAILWHSQHLFIELCTGVSSAFEPAFTKLPPT